MLMLRGTVQLIHSIGIVLLDILSCETFVTNYNNSDDDYKVKNNEPVQDFQLILERFQNC